LEKKHPWYKVDFAEFLVLQGALRFGDFKLRSGRKSPYFLNMGAIDTGNGLRRLGRSYASLIQDLMSQEKIHRPEYLFGPAYKGFPLAIATAMQLDALYDLDVAWGCDRKEEKGWGEQAKLVGAKPQTGKNTLIIEDVFTTGETKEVAVDFLNSIAQPNIEAILIAMDRGEALDDDRTKTAVAAFYDARGIPTHSILTVYEAIDILHNRVVGDTDIALTTENKQRMLEYLAQYGVNEEAE